MPGTILSGSGESNKNDSYDPCPHGTYSLMGEHSIIQVNTKTSYLHTSMNNATKENSELRMAFTFLNDWKTQKKKNVLWHVKIYKI